MRKEGFAPLVVFSLLVLVSVASAASPNVWCVPARIPPGQDVTIHIRASWPQTNITQIEVINPGGTVWSWTGEIKLPDKDDEVTVTFPSGQEQKITDPDGDVVLPDISWPAGANSNMDGKYTVYTYGEEAPPYPASTEFDVSSYFSVPELELMIPVVISIGFICLTVLRKKN